MDNKKLSGKTALITGASKGLGKAMALALAAEGARLIVVSRDQEKLETTAKEIRNAGAAAAGFLGFTKALALELASDGITVNGISPGPFATEMNTPIINDPEKNRQFVSKIPVGRWGKLEEIGRLAVYLCSEEAGFITGTDIL